MITVKNEKKPIVRQSDMFIEKFRPPTLSAVILPDHYRTLFNKIVEEKTIPNMLFYSITPGVGKTSVAKALANDCDYDYRYINTSLNGKIDMLREEIEMFASVKSFMGKKKLIILDEIDGATSDALQKALRGAMEEFHDKCRFILTANYISKIIEPLQSRCQVINFNFSSKIISNKLKPKMVKRLNAIIKKENIECVDGIVEKLVDAYYPDMRKMLNLIQEYSKSYDIINDDIFSYQDIDNKLCDYILAKNFKNARQLIVDKDYRYEELYSYIFKNVIPKMDPSVKGSAYITLEHYMNNSYHSINQEITFVACLVSLMEDMGD